VRVSSLSLVLGPLAALLLLTGSPVGLAAEKPNIVVIYADDLGYGDVGCYGATKVRTPGVDRLAREGLRFTDGHSAAATCTPSRYALLTGEYAWRRKGTGILPGNAALIIQPGRTTLASLLQKAGYTTGVVGKWHLGLGKGGLDWNGDIKPGPLEVGFDYCFLVPATGDRVPCVYVENHRVVGLDPKDPIRVSYGKPIGNEPTGRANPDLLKLKPSHGHDQTIVNGISRIGYMSGGQAARWVDEDMADVLTRKATAFIEKNAKKPFFLYFAFHDIHVPRAPHKRFVGTTDMGPRGDAIAQMDACTKQVLDTLDRLKLADNTLVVFTSDNGPVVDDGYRDQAVKRLGKHKPAGPLRGGKYSIFEGGTRVPWLVRWPGRVKPGVSDALVCQTDLLASFAALTGQKLAAEDAPDSINVLPALLGKSPRGRGQLVEQAGVLAIRQGDWKLIEPGKGPRVLANTNIESGRSPYWQLYNLADDPGEKKNVAGLLGHLDKENELQTLLAKIRADCRSRFEAGSQRESKWKWKWKWKWDGVEVGMEVEWLPFMPRADGRSRPEPGSRGGRKPQVPRDGVTRVRLLPPGPGNPRNSEGAFLPLRDGRLLFVYTHFTGGGSDHSAAHLAARFSRDGGKTWTGKDELVLPNEAKMNVMSVSLLRLASGEIGLFYLRKNATDDCRLYLRRSTDEGKTWGPPALCIPDRGYYVVNNDRVIQLKNGRLVVPASYRNAPGSPRPHPGIAICYLSDDNGKTWRKSKTELQPPRGSKTGLQEPGLVELRDGKLMMLCRTDQGCQYRSWSSDGGETWSRAQPTDLKSPVSPASVKRIPKTGDLLLVWNDHSRIDPTRRGKRTPLTVAISRDEGKTWEKVKTLEDDPDGWYCYTAIAFVGDRVVLGHCAGNSKIGRLNLTQITLFDLDWLYR
jgi:arylsulfatase A-like enzyme